MRRRAGVIAVGVMAAVGLAWWLAAELEVPDGPQVNLPATPGMSLDQPFVRSTQAEEGRDAGVGHVSGQVVDAELKPVEGARVRLYARAPALTELECGVCHLKVLLCEDPGTVARVIEMLRQGTVPTAAPLAEVSTGADGRFAFEDAPLDGEVYATTAVSSAISPCGLEPLELTLEGAFVQEVHVADFDGKVVPNARVTLFSPREGTVVEKRLDTEGRVTLEALDRGAWFFAEAEGTMPAGQLIDEGGELVLSPPRTLIIRSLLGGKPVDADVAIVMHGEPRKLRTREGLLRLERIPFGYYAVQVGSAELAAAEQSAELAEPITELVFELRQSARLLVTVVSASGEPLELVNGSLSGNEASANSEASQGALLILGPIPEGEYALRVGAQGMVSGEQPIDLKPGENTIEVVMRPAPKLSGVVRGPDGKPVAMARVGAWESDQEIALNLTDEEGRFELELHYAGSFLVRAEEQSTGVAEGSAVVPGPALSLQLVSRGVLEVEVIDADGQPLPTDVMVRSEKDHSVKWVDAQEGHVGRLAGLSPGAYVVEKLIPERLPIARNVEIVEGKVTKVLLKADRGSTVSGRVVDAQGKPVGQAMVTLTGRQETVVTAADGRFEWKGAAAGPVEIFAMHQNGGETPHLKVSAPSADVVLVLAEVARVTGRVVDEKGAPVTIFGANGERVKSGEGRFSVPAPNRTLDVWVEGYAAVFISPAEGDVGEVMLKKQPVIEGEVFDGEGKLVSGATVMASLDLMPATTDASGHFKLSLISEAPQDFVATRGAMSGRAPARPGVVAHIVMERGTAVTGKVVDAKGKPVPTQITATSPINQRPFEFDTDETGHFQLDLPQGVWIFSTRYNRVNRAIDVRGARLEITLGEEPGSCGLSLRSSKRIDAVWLLSSPLGEEDGPWDLMGRSAGSVEVPVNTPAMQIDARGLPCGRFTLSASIENVVTSVPLDLRSAAQQVQIEPRAAEPEVTPFSVSGGP